MSPEQVEGHSSEEDVRTDEYTLGAVLYEALTGRPPHPGKTLEEVYASILTKDPAPLRSLNSAIPEELEASALKALEKDGSRRSASAHALAEDLERWLRGDPV